ncbi:hypothetical protein B9T16_08040 [Arthrospira sp. PCC 8006]
MKSPPGGYFGYCNPISCLNVSHLYYRYIIEAIGLSRLENQPQPPRILCLALLETFNLDTAIMSPLDAITASSN